jgi:hypothetical protein
MSKLTIALYSVLSIGVLLVLYKFVFNPQIVSSPSTAKASKCPDRWTFDGKLCHPQYNTQCMPLDPSKVTSAYQGCNIARTCGTNWPGMCA